MDNVRLMYEVEKRHTLYDPQRPFYKDVLKKDKIWKDTGELLGVTSKETVHQLTKAIVSLLICRGRTHKWHKKKEKSHPLLKLCVLFLYIFLEIASSVYVRKRCEMFEGLFCGTDNNSDSSET